MSYSTPPISTSVRPSPYDMLNQLVPASHTPPRILALGPSTHRGVPSPPTHCFNFFYVLCIFYVFCLFCLLYLFCKQV